MSNEISIIKFVRDVTYKQDLSLQVLHRENFDNFLVMTHLSDRHTVILFEIIF